MTIGICKMFDEAKIPTRGTNKSAGLDFYVPEYSDIYKEYFLNKNKDCGLDGINNLFWIPTNSSVVIPTGIKVKIPTGKALIFFNRSGIAVKKHLVLGACVVDEDYQGEIFINLNNLSGYHVDIKFGEKITQGVLLDVAYADVKVYDDEKEMYTDHESERGDGAMGSTNHK